MEQQEILLQHSNSHNTCKVSRTKKSSSGYEHVYKNGKRWRIQFYVENKLIAIGSFDNAEEASQVYHKLKNESYLVIDQYQRERKNERRLARSHSGIFGIYKHTTKNKWAASIKIDNKFRYIGYFNNKEDAIKAQEKKYKLLELKKLKALDIQ